MIALEDILLISCMDKDLIDRAWSFDWGRWSWSWRWKWSLYNYCGEHQTGHMVTRPARHQLYFVKSIFIKGSLKEPLMIKTIELIYPALYLILISYNFHLTSTNQLFTQFNFLDYPIRAV